MEAGYKYERNDDSSGRYWHDVFSVILFAVSIVYRKTAGRRIREELMREYK